MVTSQKNLDDGAPITLGEMRDFMVPFMSDFMTNFMTNFMKGFMDNTLIPYLELAFANSEARMKKYTDNSTEELAGMIARRFDGLESRLDKRIDDLESRMEYRFSGVQKQLDAIYLEKASRQEMHILSTRVKKVERKLGLA